MNTNAAESHDNADMFFRVFTHWAAFQIKEHAFKDRKATTYMALLGYLPANNWVIGPDCHHFGPIQFPDGSNAKRAHKPYCMEVLSFSLSSSLHFSFNLVDLSC